MLDNLLALNSAALPLLGKTLVVLGSPGVPLCNVALAHGELLGGALVLLGGIFFVESTREFLEVLADLLLRVLGKEGSGTWAPQELLELVLVVLDELEALEVPNSISWLGLNVS